MSSTVLGALESRESESKLGEVLGGRGLRRGAGVVVRERPGVVARLESFGVGRRAVWLVDVGYVDGLEPASERLLWHVEMGREPLDGAALGAMQNRLPMRDFLRGALELKRENLISLPGFPDGEGGKQRPVAPALCRLEPDPHQLVPLEKALERRRVRLLLADEPGLGKTLQAGLVVCELIHRRRAGRALILSPPGLMENWQFEMERSFGLKFAIIDGQSVRGRGREASVWTQAERAICSYHWLKRPDVLRGFLEAQQHADNGPWDMLVVDEAHHLVAPAGATSQLQKAMEQVVGWFPHRVFLTATPHSGYVDSLMALLQLLDPLRFQRCSTPSPAMLAEMRSVVVRRTGSAVEGPATLPPLERLVVRADPGSQELNVIRSWERFRDSLVSWVSGNPELAGRWLLALQTLEKRMLSSLPAFESSFNALVQHLELSGLGLSKSLIPEDAAWSSSRGIEAGSTDALGMSNRGGSRRPQGYRADLSQEAEWLPPAGELLLEIAGRFSLPLEERAATVLRALEQFRTSEGEGHQAAVRVGARLEAALAWIEGDGKQGGRGKYLVFSEYAATARAMGEALAMRPGFAQKVAILDSETAPRQRVELLNSFCTAEGAVQVLVSTDVAGEGLNLHEACSSVIHLDLPWNPGRIAQRTGRVLRRGQARSVREVMVLGGSSAERRFLGRLKGKSSSIARDIGLPEETLLSNTWFEAERAPVVARELPLVVPEAQAEMPRGASWAETGQMASSQGPGDEGSWRREADRGVCCLAGPNGGMDWASGWRVLLGPPNADVAPLQRGAWALERLWNWRPADDLGGLLALVRWLALDGTQGWLVRWASSLWFRVMRGNHGPVLGSATVVEAEAMRRLLGRVESSSCSGPDPAWLWREGPPSVSDLWGELMYQLRQRLQERWSEAMGRFPAALRAHARAVKAVEIEEVERLRLEHKKGALARARESAESNVRRQRAVGESRGWLFAEQKARFWGQLRAQEAGLLRTAQEMEGWDAAAHLDPFKNSVARSLLAARCKAWAPPVLSLEGAALFLRDVG